MVHSKSIGATWRHLLLHASPAYWAIQAVVALGALAPSLLAASLSNVPQPLQFLLLLRGIGDALLLFLATHLVLRPILRLWFVGQPRRLKDWAYLSLVVAVLALLMATLERPIAGLGSLGTSESLDAIVIKTTSRVLEFDLTGGHPQALALFDRFGELAVWALFYVALKALQNRRQLERQVRQARLRQLTYQLSPHFLFNAFNSIRGMIFEDRERAADLITQLSELFRFHLNHEARTEQTLAEEWELARRYLDLETIRLESRLRLDVALDEDCIQRRLPSLTLLTLVENAIKHGIAPNVDGGRLRILAKTSGKGWWLEVANTVGEGRATHSTGTGLANLKERLALSLGAAASIVSFTEGGEFVFRLEIAT